MAPTLPARLIARQVALGSLALSASGQIAFCRRTVEKGAYRTRIWLVPWAGGRPRALTRGDGDDSAPAFDPSGERLAFVRGEQVHVIELDGGEPVALTALRHGVSAFRWSPDGNPPAADGGRRRAALRGRGAARQRAAAGAPHHAAGLALRRHRGARPARPPLGAGGAAGRAARQITSGEWSPDGAAWLSDDSVMFSADRGPDPDLTFTPALWVVGLAGGEPRELCRLPGGCRRPALAPDGRAVFAGNPVELAPSDVNERLYAVAPGGGEPEPLAHDERMVLDLGLGSDLVDWRGELEDGIAFDAGGVPVTAAVLDGECALWRFPASGKPERIGPAGRELHTWAAGGGRFAAALSDGIAPPEVWAVEDGGARRLTRSCSGWARPLAGVTSERVEVDGPAGPIPTWVVHPAGAGRKPLPTILSIHGGPTCSWGPCRGCPTCRWPITATACCARTPRGSSSYDPAWVTALMGDWGGPDAADCLAVCDWAVGAKLAHPKRLGVFGLSYGGFLAHWLIGHTDRFAAAVSANGVANQIAAMALCDYGLEFNLRDGWGMLPGHAMEYWRRSPLAYADEIATPLLMLQGEADQRCPPADNQQLFFALRALRREVEYILYPEESHLMQSVARPDRRIDMQERTLAWFAGHGV